jgi:hypothetical protein
MTLTIVFNAIHANPVEIHRRKLRQCHLFSTRAFLIPAVNSHKPNLKKNVICNHEWYNILQQKLCKMNNSCWDHKGSKVLCEHPSGHIIRPLYWLWCSQNNYKTWVLWMQQEDLLVYKNLHLYEKHITKSPYQWSNLSTNFSPYNCLAQLNTRERQVKDI